MTAFISVSVDIKRTTRYLNRTQRKQLPFATARALTWTANDAKKAETAQMPRKLDRPTKFTQGAIAILPANKRQTNMVASVFVKSIQAEYLKYQIEGGVRNTTGAGTGVPTRNKKLNMFGNIPGRRKGLVKGKKQFIGKIHGITGVWERTGGKRNRGVKLMIAFHKRVEYRPRFPFYKIARGVATSMFKRNFEKSLKQALRSAR